MFEYETDGKTAMCIAIDGREVGAVAVADTLKVRSQSMVSLASRAHFTPFLRRRRRFPLWQHSVLWALRCG